MFSLKAKSWFSLPRGDVAAVECPVVSDRTFVAMREAMGGHVKIDGVEYVPIGFEMNMPNTPTYIGEKIGILVRERIKS